MSNKHGELLVSELFLVCEIKLLQQSVDVDVV